MQIRFRKIMADKARIFFSWKEFFGELLNTNRDAQEATPDARLNLPKEKENINNIDEVRRAVKI